MSGLKPKKPTKIGIYHPIVDAFKTDSTNLANNIESAKTSIRRQLDSGNESSMDSARTTFWDLAKKTQKLKEKYPNKKF